MLSTHKTAIVTLRQQAINVSDSSKDWYKIRNKLKHYCDTHDLHESNASYWYDHSNTVFDSDGYEIEGI